MRLRDSTHSQSSVDQLTAGTVERSKRRPGAAWLWCEWLRPVASQTSSPEWPHAKQEAQHIGVVVVVVNSGGGGGVELRNPPGGGIPSEVRE